MQATSASGVFGTATSRPAHQSRLPRSSRYNAPVATPPRWRAHAPTQSIAGKRPAFLLPRTSQPDAQHRYAPRTLSSARMHPHMLRHIATRHTDPRTIMRYDRARKNLDRHPNGIVALTRRVQASPSIVPDQMASARSRAPNGPSGGSGQWRHTRPTPSTSRRLTDRSRCSCSTRSDRQSRQHPNYVLTPISSLAPDADRPILLIGKRPGQRA